MRRTKNVILFLMSERGLRVAESVVARHPELINAIVCERDASVQKDYFEEIANVARINGISFFDRQEFAGETIDPKHWAIAVSWRWLIRISDGKLIVLHDSLLPRYRGFNPLVTALIAGDESIGASALVATGEFDRGPIISRRIIPVAYPLRISEAISQISNAYIELVEEVFATIESGETLRSTAQDEAEASYSLWRDEDDYRLDWRASSRVLQRTIHATGFPYKGALSTIDGTNYRLLDADVLPDIRIANRAPGKVIWLDQGCPVVVCGEGLLKITQMIDGATGSAALPFRRLRVRFR